MAFAPPPSGQIRVRTVIDGRVYLTDVSPGDEARGEEINREEAKRYARAKQEREEALAPDLAAGKYTGSVRTAVRKKVESLSETHQFAASMIVPTLFSAAAARVTRDPKKLAAVNAAAEYVGTEIGLQSIKDRQIFLAAAVPYAMRGLIGFPNAVRKILRRGPAYRQAVDRRLSQWIAARARKTADSLHGEPAGPLWTRLTKMGVIAPRNMMEETQNVLMDISNQAKKFASNFAEKKDFHNTAQGLLDRIFKQTRQVELSSKWQNKINPNTGQPRGGIKYKIIPNEPIPLNELVENIKALGRELNLLEKTGGVIQGTRKRIFEAFWNDMERIGINSELGKGVDLWKRARKASMMEYAVDDYTNIIEGAITHVPGKGNEVRLGASKVLDILKGMINDKHPLYEKNFANSLGKTEGFKKSIKLLEEANTFPARGMGPGGLAIMGKFALAGASIASAFGAPAWLAGGAGVYALSLPEKLTDFLLSPRGQKHLHKIIRSHSKKFKELTINMSALTATKLVTRGHAGPLIETGKELYGKGQDLRGLLLEETRAALDRLIKGSRPGPKLDPVNIIRPESFLPVIADPLPEGAAPEEAPVSPDVQAPVTGMGGKAGRILHPASRQRETGVMAAPPPPPASLAPPPAEPLASAPAAGPGLAAAPGPTPRTLIPTRTKELADYLKNKSYDPMAMP